jgi:hypothetical protein
MSSSAAMGSIVAMKSCTQETDQEKLQQCSFDPKDRETVKDGE